MNAKRKSLLLAATLLVGLASTLRATADDHDISFDSGVDFRALHTFAIGNGQIVSTKPEIDNRLFRQRMEESIRAALVKRGLKETADHPDVTVSYSLHDKDVSSIERHPRTRIPDSPTSRGFVIPGSEPNDVLSTEGTLVIDINNASSSLLWRGTWIDQEQSSPALSRNLSDDAHKLLSYFPPKRR